MQLLCFSFLPTPEEERGVLLSSSSKSSSSSSSSSSSLLDSSFSLYLKTTSGSSSSSPSLVNKRTYISLFSSSTSSSCIIYNLDSKFSRNSLSKKGWFKSSLVLHRTLPSMTRHLRIKSMLSSSIFFSNAYKLTSLVCSGYFTASDANGAFIPSKRGFIRKAILCFLESS
jgi:hypothetical protein